jgi:hypothetical protein
VRNRGLRAPTSLNPHIENRALLEGEGVVVAFCVLEAVVAAVVRSARGAGVGAAKLEGPGRLAEQVEGHGLLIKGRGRAALDLHSAARGAFHAPVLGARRQRLLAACRSRWQSFFALLYIIILLVVGPWETRPVVFEGARKLFSLRVGDLSQRIYRKFAPMSQLTNVERGRIHRTALASL